MTLPIYIDTDNAVGSGQGDVDDGFALAAILWSGLPIVGVSSVFGNTDAAAAAKCTRRLLDLSNVGANLAVTQGARFAGELRTPASLSLAGISVPFRVLALGPLTNIAAALLERPALAELISEIIVVGGCVNRSGFYPPIYPFDFNLTKDRWATKFLWSSKISVTLFPLDVTENLPLRLLPDSKSDLGLELNEEAARWLRRNRRMGKPAVPVWDLAPAIYAINPELFRFTYESARLSFWCRTWIGEGARPIRVIRGFNPATVWSRFEQLHTTSRC